MTELIRAVSAAILTVGCTLNASPTLSTPAIDISNTPTIEVQIQEQEPIEFTIMSEFDEPVVEEVIQEPVFPYTDEEVYQLALITMAEAEGEPELGQRLVIDTVLNRIDTPGFANSVIGVIYEEGQFESTRNGRIEQVTVTDRMLQLCREEMVSRTNSDVVFFRTGKYSKYGTPLFTVGHHYFSGV